MLSDAIVIMNRKLFITLSSSWLSSWSVTVFGTLKVESTSLVVELDEPSPKLTMELYLDGRDTSPFRDLIIVPDKVDWGYLAMIL